MEWNIRDDLPIYAQLIYQMKSAIASGRLLPGDRLASVRDMALEARVNPNTMQRAMSELEREGFVYSQRTSGRFVTEDVTLIESIKTSLAQEQAKLYFESMAGLGYGRDEAVESLIKYKENNDGNT